MRVVSMEPALDGTNRVIMDVEWTFVQTWWESRRGKEPRKGRSTYIGSGGSWHSFPSDKYMPTFHDADGFLQKLYRLWRDHERGEDAA